MADYVPAKWKPVASQISLMNNGNWKKAQETRLLGFEPHTVGTFYIPFGGAGCSTRVRGVGPNPITRSSGEYLA